MALVDIYNIYKGKGSLQARFMAACLVAAKDIVAEDPGTANHAERVAWAEAIQQGGEDTLTSSALEILRFAAASNATLQSAGEAATDNDIQFIVNTELARFI